MSDGAQRTTGPTPNAAAPREEGTTRVRGVDLSWTAEGEGPLVVWAHGTTDDRWALEEAGSYDWSPVVASGHRLVRYDARGHGRSTSRPVAADHTWSNLADDLLALLDALSPERPVTVVGSSMGTASALLAALRAPERFAGLVLTAAPTAWGTRAGQAAVYEQAAAFVEHGGGAAFEAMTASQPRSGVLAELPGLPRLAVSDALLPSVLRGAAASDLVPSEEVAALRVPTLVLSWDGDPGHPVETGERLAGAIPDAQLHVATTAEELRSWSSLVVDHLAG